MWVEDIERDIYNYSVGEGRRRLRGVVVHPGMWYEMMVDGSGLVRVVEDRMYYRGLRVIRSGDLGRGEIVLY
jgi:hypothetical protein